MFPRRQRGTPGEEFMTGSSPAKTASFCAIELPPLDVITVSCFTMT